MGLYFMFFAAGVKWFESDIIIITIIITMSQHTSAWTAWYVCLRIVTHFEQICMVSLPRYVSSDWHGVIIALNKYYFNSIAITK